MQKLISLLVLVVFITSCNKKQEPVSLLSSGISLDMANYRKQQVDSVVYDLSFNIPEKKDEPIPAQLKLQLQIKDLDYPLYLDFNASSKLLKSVVVNDEIVAIDHREEHLIIPQDYLKLGHNNIAVTFNAGELSLNRNDDYLYTLLVPDRASTLFPCFDQPNIKAQYVLNITAPKHWEVMCGAHLDKFENQGDFTQYQFKKSDKMSTYLFSFVVGDFKRTNQQIEGLNMTMLYREDNKDRLEASTDTIFKLHHESLVFLESYTKYKFPFQKLDFAVIPGFQYGGMEHVGAIQYRQSSLFLDSNATQNQELNRARLIAHETAHMWFGDLVTMRWFDDVWLKEVFANFLADKVTSQSFPEINHGLNFMSDHYGSAYSEDRTTGATPIKQPLDNLKNAGTLYGRIIYNKAPIMMRQLEALVGKEGFRHGMRNYIKTFANDNADWEDLVAILDEEIPEDLKQWSAVWVNKPGRPLILDSIVYQDNTIKHFNISQKAEDGSHNIWPQKFKIGLVYKDSTAVVPIKISSQENDITHLIGWEKPESIIYNYDAFGYGVFPMKHLNIEDIPHLDDDVARGYAYINLYENVLTAHVNPRDALDVFLEGLTSEKEELVLGIIRSRIVSVFWNFISSEQRTAMQSDIEGVIYQQLISEDLSPSYKKTLFGLYKSIAYSKEGLSNLYDIWSKTKPIKGLHLNAFDLTNLAATLAIYNHPHSNTILEKALNDISNPDRKKRFAFLMPSLSQSNQVRDDFVMSLKDSGNREKESWVSTALYYINHPLRQEAAQKHLRFYLDLLEDIQITGDIFFPKSWLNATLGNYSSEYAYQILEQFLADHPDYPTVLKNKILQASNGIYRAKRIRLKYP
ncbi:M1 family metallopeptidase [Cognatitamlana onchidii]|uniref:M1 family metallopeptidase n=1 Tax=Cognatitamlana onchidii TaxID=2562860 RepID=UPI0010A63A00|nr:M1 family aminopeptidase [Algibacter onchidii]